MPNTTFGNSLALMMEEAEARARIFAHIAPLVKRRVVLTDAYDCFSTNACFARIALPAFDNSAMDGYALVASDGAKGARLRVTGEQPAGVDRQLTVGAGEAIRIFTGAPIPQGASAVVMQEDVSREDDCIALNVDVEEGEFIRRRACDLAEGQQIVAKGQRIRPTTAALLASQGFVDLEVGGQARVAVISTGDEIVPQGQEIQPGQIYDSNSVLLRGLVGGLGANVTSARHCPDDEGALTSCIKDGAIGDVVILTGGVSVGAHDLVQSVIRALGGSIDVWRVALKPGKPFLFGRLGNCAIFGLPGNPVSAFVTFLKFVRPAILKMMGANDAEQALTRVRARLAEDLENRSDRAHYVRGCYEDGAFVPVGRQESHALFGLSASNALAQLPAGARFEAGKVLDVEIWD